MICSNDMIVMLLSRMQNLSATKVPTQYSKVSRAAGASNLGAKGTCRPLRRCSIWANDPFQRLQTNGIQISSENKQHNSLFSHLGLGPAAKSLEAWLVLSFKLTKSRNTCCQIEGKTLSQLRVQAGHPSPNWETKARSGNAHGYHVCAHIYSQWFDSSKGNWDLDSLKLLTAAMSGMARKKTGQKRQEL